jgi:hypothetical protein
MMLELIQHEGTVNVPCDLLVKILILPIEGEMKLLVRFGDNIINDNEELLILPKFDLN